jgi:ubiquinone biosynthesis protein
MKITSIPQIYRHLARWREIFSVLSKYGLANWISRLDLEFAKEFFKDPDGESLARLSRETRVRLALNELGPTFIKLGQILSTRPDLVGIPLATELQHLQDEVRSDPPDIVRAAVQAELGKSVDELFASFEDQPLASASIGQCHAARLQNGDSVVVKVQHPAIHDKVRVDLDILNGMAILAERVPEFENYRPRAMVDEFQRSLMRELDFSREQRHMQQFASDFAADETIRIPSPYPELSTARVLTMQRLEGIKLSETEKLRDSGFDSCEVARRGAEIYLSMIFKNGFYHADPHPGNLVVMPGNTIGLLDYGLVGRIDEPLREDIEEMLVALGNRDAQHLTSIIVRLGAAPAGLDQGALSQDVADFMSHYALQRLDSFDLSGALNEIIDMIHRYQIMLPTRITLLMKVLVMLEGTSRLLSPRFNLLELMKPYRKEMVWSRLSPARQVRKVRRFYIEMERLLAELPLGLTEIFHQVQTGKFDVHLEHRGLEPSVNRLVFGMLTSALFLGSTLLLSQKVAPLVRLPWLGSIVGEFSLLGALGCGISIALGLRLLRAISKSGHLDRDR